VAVSEQAFQDQGAVEHCYGCGADNQLGLHIKSYWNGDEAVATWQAQPHHCGGRKDIVNGGVIATLIDCHSLNLAIAHAYRSEQRPIGSAPRIGYVTGNLSISYLRPTPMGEPLHLRARITKTDRRKVWVNCTLSAAGVVCATGEVLGVRVQRH
jgi:acyl-coenzyme A thioesterase PaaI-like protein